MEENRDSRWRGNDGGDLAERQAWMPKFLEGLIATGSVRESVEDAGVDFEVAWALRQRSLVFRVYWDRAVRVHKAVSAGVPLAEAAKREELADIARVRAAREAIALDRMEGLW